MHMYSIRTFHFFSNFSKGFQKIHNKITQICKEDSDKLKQAKMEDNLHETLLDNKHATL